MRGKTSLTKRSSSVDALPGARANRRAYSIDNLTEVLPFSKGFLRSEIKNGHLKGTRFNRRLVVMDVDRHDYLRRKRMESAA
jgi:hypothetical protein